MKKEGSLKSILSLLVIVLVILVSLGGIYVKDKNIMKNILPEYSLGMELDTNTIIKLEVDKPEETSSENTQEESNSETENEAEKTEDASTENESVEENTDTTKDEEKTENQDENNEAVEENKEGQAQENIYTADNYKKSKKIIEDRMEKSDVDQYTLRLDENTGEIVIEVSEEIDSTTLQQLFAVGKTEIKISENDELIGDINSIKNVTTAIDNSYKSSLGSFVRINIEFTKDATNKFKEIKNNYVVPTDETGAAKENNVIISIDGSQICSLTETEFLESASVGTLPLILGSYTTDVETLNSTLAQADTMKNIMNSEQLPVAYSVSYANDVHSNVNSYGVISVLVVILAVMFICLTIKFKLKGIISTVNILGFISVLLLVLRLLKVQISLASIVALVVMAIVQFVYLIKVLSSKNITSKVFNNKTIEFTKILIPTFLISVIIAFADILEISAFGMVMFWGLILFEIFNNILTRAILTNGKNK